MSLIVSETAYYLVRLFVGHYKNELENKSELEKRKSDVIRISFVVCFIYFISLLAIGVNCGLIKLMPTPT